MKEYCVASVVLKSLIALQEEGGKRTESDVRSSVLSYDVERNNEVPLLPARQVDNIAVETYASKTTRQCYSNNVALHSDHQNSPQLVADD